MVENNFYDKIIAVVGGTKGVGKGVVAELVKQGATVVIGGRDENAALEIIKSVKELNGQCSFVEISLESTKSCQLFFDTILEKHKRLDGFFNYAGITSAASLLEIEETHFNSIFDINIRGAMFCCKSALKIMKETGGGSIVLTGSPHAWAGEEDRVAYACSKGSIITLSDHISRHYAKFGIRSNYITMGWTPTEGELAMRKANGMSEQELRTLAAEFIPAGRMTEIDDIVPGVIYLLSDASKMVSGSNLRVTGGWFM